MYYKVMTTTARHAHTVSTTSTCSHDVWNIDMELVRTRFRGSIIFHIHSIFFEAKMSRWQASKNTRLGPDLSQLVNLSGSKTRDEGGKHRGGDM
jgi:hypothetical protein